MKLKHMVGILPLVIILLVGIIPLQIQIQEYEVAMNVLRHYNDDEVFTIPNVHYCEETYDVERGFPDFWNIKLVVSYVTAEYPDGEMKYYVVYTDIDSMEYEIL